MAEPEPERNDSGSKDRATVALVDAKVDGLRDLIRAEFGNVKEDVRALAAVVADVIKQGVQIGDHERRLRKLEDGNAGAEHERRILKLEGGVEGNREWRRVKLPTIIIGCIGALGTIYAVLQTIHVHL